MRARRIWLRIWSVALEKELKSLTLLNEYIIIIYSPYTLFLCLSIPHFSDWTFIFWLKVSTCKRQADDSGGDGGRKDHMVLLRFNTFMKERAVCKCPSVSFLYITADCGAATLSGSMLACWTCWPPGAEGREGWKGKMVVFLLFTALPVAVVVICVCSLWNFARCLINDSVKYTNPTLGNFDCW